MNPTVSQTIPDLPAGGGVALARLTPTLYRDLRRIASRHLSAERANHTLQATALVHEAYLKLAEGRQRSFHSDVHFLAVASRVMRQVLVDYARSRSTLKREGEAHRFSLSNTTIQVEGDQGPSVVDLLVLDDALEALASVNERLPRLIEMRYFGGMTAEESAEALEISVHIVRHELRFAEAWLRRRLTS